MDQKRLASRCMFVGGVLEIIAGLLHFLMPAQATRTADIAALSGDSKDVVFLCIVSIGLCLSVFGCLSIYFSNKLVTGDRSAWVFGISQGVLWMVRTVFELLWPVRVPLFFLSNPTIWLVPLLLMLAMLYLVPLLGFKKELLKRRTSHVTR